MHYYRPGYFLLPVLPVQRFLPPKRADGWFGRLELEATCLTPLHVGSGVPSRVLLNGRPALVEGFTTLRGPRSFVVPGSGMKGAVRAIVEALTPSCERTGRGGCDGRGDLCPACTLLGAPGWRATVAFSDLRPLGEPRPIAQTIAQRYSHRNAPARGRRLYRREPESPQPADQEVLLVLEAGSKLAGEVALLGATDWGLGLLTIALGLPPHGVPYLRLGGGKNRGLGVVRFEQRGLTAESRGLDPRTRPSVSPQAVAEWQGAALAQFPALGSRAEAIRGEYGAP